MTRLVLRKSLLVSGLLVTVLGVPAAASAAVHASTGHPSTGHSSTGHSSTGHSSTGHSSTGHPGGGVRSAITTAAVHPALPASGLAPVGPVLTPMGGVCSVPGIGDIGSLLGLCAKGSGLVGDLNNICQPSLPQPEPANGGIDSIIRPPAAGGPQGKTLYDNYGVAGQFWAATDLQCSDMTSLIGNNVAGMVFDASKAVDRVTITVYQSAAGNGILSWLQTVVNRLITSLGNAIYFPYLAPVVLLGVVWLAWHGLIRKRATRTIEGTIWMVIACAAAIWLIGRPADFTGVGTSVSNGVTQVLNVAFSKLPAPSGSNCVPVASGDPQSASSGSFGFTAGNGLVDQNANELWSVLICKPWLDGEFGTTAYSTGKTGRTLVNTYGRQLLWAQAIAANERPTAALIQAKQSVYSGIASGIKASDPGVYPLFQGNQWTSRLMIGFAALFAALVAGVLVLLIAITLIILKLGFLLLLVAGPFFLIVGTHPGFGRVVAMRWVEMIIGVLLKQVAVALVLSILLYAYSLIMGSSDAVLPWALKILMIALVTLAVFIYRKPFQHLFSAVGYGSIGARERAEIEMYRSREVMRRTATGAAAVAGGAAGGFAGYRVGRWSRRDITGATSLAEHIAMAGAAGNGTARNGAAGVGQQPVMAGAASGTGDADGSGAAAGEAGDGQYTGSGTRPGAGGNGRAWAAAGVTRNEGGPRSAPPLHLPPRAGRSGDQAATPSGWARSGAEGVAAGRAPGLAGDPPPRPVLPRLTRSPAVPGRPAAPRSAQGGAAAPPPGLLTPRSRWRGAAPAAPSPASSGRTSQGPRGRNGRPLWQPGPIRPSGGWSGPAGGQARAPGASPGSGSPPLSSQRGGAAPPGASQLNYPHAGARAGAGAGPPRDPQPAGNGGPAHAASPAVPPGGHGGSGAGGDARPEAPLPFWLRPVRRKK